MLLGGLNMRDNLEELSDIFNVELINIKVSEELKIRTLEKCKRNKRALFHEAFTPITWTIVACLFMGVIIYPIYNKSNSIKTEQIVMNTSDKGIEALNKPNIDSAILSNEVDIMEDKSSEVKSKETIEENKDKVNKKSEEQKQVLALNENTTIPFKMESPTEREIKDVEGLGTDKGIVTNINEGIIDKDISIKDERTVVLPVEKQDNFGHIEESKMRALSLQEARIIIGEGINIPTYIPLGFAIEKVLVPQIQNDSNKLYEVVYRNNAQYFIITEYKDINNTSELDLNITGENSRVININKIPVKYIVYEVNDGKELPYAIFIWSNKRIMYSVKGSIPWSELINIISSTIG
jgi:hypothetical protein